MTLSVMRVLDKSLDTFFKNFLYYLFLFFLVLFVKISVFAAMYMTLFFNKTVSLFSDAKAVQMIIDLFLRYDRLIELFLYPLFFCVAVSIINNQPEKWKSFLKIRLWVAYALWNLVFLFGFGILFCISMLIYALFYEFGVAAFLNWLQQREFWANITLFAFNIPLFLAQLRFFLVPYLLVETQLPILQVIKESFSKTRSHSLFLVRMILVGGLIVWVLAMLPHVLSFYSQEFTLKPLYKICFFLFFNAAERTFFCAMMTLSLAYASREILREEN